jgi:hypothetical protein
MQECPPWTAWDLLLKSNSLLQMWISRCMLLKQCTDLINDIFCSITMGRYSVGRRALNLLSAEGQLTRGQLSEIP